MIDTFDLVKSYSNSIKNNRDVYDVYYYAHTEMKELDIELDAKINGHLPGADGVVGEAIDVISCMLDIIMLEDPSFTSEQFNQYLHKKCEKWKSKYHKET